MAPQLNGVSEEGALRLQAKLVESLRKLSNAEPEILAKFTVSVLEDLERRNAAGKWEEEGKEKEKNKNQNKKMLQRLTAFFFPSALVSWNLKKKNLLLLLLLRRECRRLSYQESFEERFGGVQLGRQCARDFCV